MSKKRLKNGRVKDRRAKQGKKRAMIDLMPRRYYHPGEKPGRASITNEAKRLRSREQKKPLPPRADREGRARIIDAIERRQRRAAKRKREDYDQRFREIFRDGGTGA